MYDENVAQYDELQLRKDNLDRLRRQAIQANVTTSEGRQVVYPSGYTPPEVERKLAHDRYRRAVATHRAYSRRRLRNQGRDHHRW